MVDLRPRLVFSLSLLLCHPLVLFLLRLRLAFPPSQSFNKTVPSVCGEFSESGMLQTIPTYYYFDTHQPSQKREKSAGHIFSLRSPQIS